MKLFTIGHSTHPIEEFVGMLGAHGVRKLVDIRTIPKSRRNPQFAGESLAQSLPANGISYDRMEALGGLRKTSADSPNGAWRNLSFRGYADYMQSPTFADAVEQLIEEGHNSDLAIMCAEAVPWRCHRSLVGDALVVRGVEVLDIMTAQSAKPHTLTSFARVDGTHITYPPEEAAE